MPSGLPDPLALLVPRVWPVPLDPPGLPAPPVHRAFRVPQDLPELLAHKGLLVLRVPLDPLGPPDLPGLLVRRAFRAPRGLPALRARKGLWALPARA